MQRPGACCMLFGAGRAFVPVAVPIGTATGRRHVVYTRRQRSGLHACASRNPNGRGNGRGVSSGSTSASRRLPLSSARPAGGTEAYTGGDADEGTDAELPMGDADAGYDSSDPSDSADESPEEIARRIRAQTDDISFEEDPGDHKMGFAAIIGRPNAGKSTLMNHILGQQLSIVTAKAQTTRHKVSGIWSEAGHQVVFLDTPGIIINQRDELEERMMTAVGQAIKDADILLAIVDATDRPQEALDMLQPGSDWRGPPMAILLNKVDMMDEEEEAGLIEWYESTAKNAAVFPISADTGDGVAAVKQWVVENIPEGPSMFPKDVLAEANERFFVSEIIRKQVFEQYRQELPYQVTVLVTDFKERRPPQKTFIAAQVVVEKERHVKLLVGAKGVAIKALSKASREEIEEFLDSPVYLDLSVKVVPKWRSEKSSLERLGYGV